MPPLLTPATADIFDELGFPPAEAAHTQLRATLLVALLKALKRKKITQAAAATLLGISQPRVSDLHRGKIDKFSLDALVELLGKAGLRVTVEVAPQRTPQARRRSRAAVV